MQRTEERWFHVVLDWTVDLWHAGPQYWWFLLTIWCKNTKFLFKHIINMRPWDSSFNIDLFVHSLEYTAHGLKNGHSILSERLYRRCLTAAGLLDRAYHFEVYNDKSYMNWFKRNPRSFVKLDNSRYSQLVSTSKDPVEYSDNMYKIIHRRLDKQEKRMKKEAWEYLHKYIEHCWD